MLSDNTINRIVSLQLWQYKLTSAHICLIDVIIPTYVTNKFDCFPFSFIIVMFSFLPFFVGPQFMRCDHIKDAHKRINTNSGSSWKWTLKSPFSSDYTGKILHASLICYNSALLYSILCKRIIFHYIKCILFNDYMRE